MSRILFYRSDCRANATRQVDDEYGGVGYYRIVQPAKFVKGHEVDVVGMNFAKKGERKDDRWKRLFKDYDIFWTSYFSDPEEASAMYYYRDKLHKKVVIDLDDDYLDILPTHSFYDRMKAGKRDKAFMSTILSFADVITVSTEPLKQRLDDHMRKVYKLEKKIIVVPNMNDATIWDFKPAEKHKDKIVVGYMGSNSHYDDLKMFLPQMAKIMDKYQNVYFESFGALGKVNLELFTCFSESAKLRSDILGSTNTFKEYPEYISKKRWDIGVAPLSWSKFTECKSHIKWLEYSMYKIPVIASRVYPYYVPCFGRDIIKNEETGLLVKPNEWFDALERLILDKDLRERLGTNAYNYIRENWQYSSDFADVIANVINSL